MHVEEVSLPFANRLQEAVSRESAADELGPAPCPWCGAPLRMRVDCHWPHFVCACVPRKEMSQAG